MVTTIRKVIPLKRYNVNEVYYAIQPRGVRSGRASAFVCFGQHCERVLRADEIVSSVITQCANYITRFNRGKRWIVLKSADRTDVGNHIEPEFCESLHRDGFLVAIETNGTVDLTTKFPGPGVGRTMFDHITLDLFAGRMFDEIKQREVTELIYHIALNDHPPSEVNIIAKHYYFSPIFDEAGKPNKAALAWCNELALSNVGWAVNTPITQAV